MSLQADDEFGTAHGFEGGMMSLLPQTASALVLALVFLSVLRATPTAFAQAWNIDHLPPRHRPAATAIHRIERGAKEVRVYEAGQLVNLPWFTELLVVSRANRQGALDNLVGKSVALVRSANVQDQWDVYADVPGMGGRDFMTLADNVFRVKEILRSTRERPIEARVNGRTYVVKPGHFLLVLG